jgi:hypothetical protein
MPEWLYALLTFMAIFAILLTCFVILFWVADAVAGDWTCAVDSCIEVSNG